MSPVIGRIVIGPLSFHGVINRVFGWFLMTIFTWLVGRFGRIALLASVAALGTRMFRVPSMESISVGVGYAIGGLVFDIVYYPVYARGSKTEPLYGLLVAVVSAVATSIPYLLWKLTALGSEVFFLMSPVYAFDVLKGVVLSSLGTALGLQARSVLKSPFLNKNEK